MTEEPRELRRSVNIEKTTAVSPATIGETCSVCNLIIPESGVAWRMKVTTGPGGSIFQKVHSACYGE